MRISLQSKGFSFAYDFQRRRALKGGFPRCSPWLFPMANKKGNLVFSSYIHVNKKRERSRTRLMYTWQEEDLSAFAPVSVTSLVGGSKG